MPDVSALVAELRRIPLANAAALMQALAIGSQASLSRLVSRAGRQVVAIGQARARRYAAARQVAEVGDELPLFRVDTGGRLAQIATLRPIAPAGIFVAAAAILPRWMRGASGDGVFQGPPPFLADLRPEGFLGSRFVHRNPEPKLPDDPDAWSDDQCLAALACAGEDGIGDLVMGEASARRLYAAWVADPDIVPLAERESIYARLADEAIEGVSPGISVGGKQPKFATIVGSASTPAHLLVKFSPPEDSIAARRWRDLLVCEHIALQTLRRHAIPAVTSEILEAAGRTFLQTGRFDRVGLRGRRPVVTLRALHREYLRRSPAGGRWADAARELCDDHWIRPATRDRVRQIETFGEFIANVDLQPSDLSFIPGDDGMLALAPAYDMLPMSYAPVGGEVPEREYRVPLPQPGQEATWIQVGEMAIAYWQTVAQDARITPSFRETAAGNAAAIERARTKWGQVRISPELRNSGEIRT